MTVLPAVRIRSVVPGVEQVPLLSRRHLL